MRKGFWVIVIAVTLGYAAPSLAEFDGCRDLSSDKIAVELLPLLYPKNWPDSEPAFTRRGFIVETRNQEDDRLMTCALIYHADVIRKAIVDGCAEIAQTGWVDGKSNVLLSMRIGWALLELNMDGKCDGD